MTQQAPAANQTTDPRPPFVLALDVGTSSTRTLLFDSTGAAVLSVHAQRPYKLTTSGEGEVSVDADALVEIVGRTIDDALKSCGPMAQQIGAVAIDTFWHSLIGVDGSGHAITPVITWEDTRPHAAAMELRAQLDEVEVHRRTGARFHASYWPAKMRWLAQTYPDTFKKVDKWLSFGEYLHLKYLGHAICSPSMASATGMLDYKKRTWDTDLMNDLGVRPEQFPPVSDMSESLQGLTSEYASAWPALRGVPWYPALGDGAAAGIGSGCVKTENWSLTMGTSSAMRVVVPPDLVVPPLSLWLYLIDAKRAIIGGALSEGGNLLNWLDTVLELPSLADADTLISSLRPDGHGLTILPFISGERSIGWHADAQMTIMGMRTHTTPAEMLRAGMESLAYRINAIYNQLRDTLKAGDVLPTPRLIASGGALLGSATLQGIVADTLGIPLYPSRDHEASARGAALLALEAMGIIPDVAMVEPVLQPPVQPDAQRGAIYRTAAERQEKLYQLLLSS